MKRLTILFICSLLLSCASQETKTYQWRGEDRKGIFQEHNLMKKWPENGPKEIWYAENIGNGYGSPTITEDAIFITGEIDSTAWLFCFDLTGKIRWKQNLGKEWTTGFPGSRSAPTIAGDLVYVVTGMGNLFCLKSNDGEIVWSKDFKTDGQGIYPMHGFSEAPVIDTDKIFWTTGGKETNVLALNRFTGETIWSCKGVSERSGYNPGNLIELSNRKIFVTFSAYHLMGIDAQTGQLLWTHLQDNTPEEKRELGVGDTHSNGIIYEDGYIYYAAGDGNCGVKLQLSEDGSSITEIWRNPDFDGFMGGIIKVGDFIYGGRSSKRELLSINATTGENTDTLAIGSGALIAADNMLYYYNQRGQLSLVSYEQGKMKQESIFKIVRGTREHFSHPVIKNGILYQRHGDTLMAFDIRKGKM